MIRAIRATIRDLMTPDIGAPYKRGIIAIAHAQVLAAFVSPWGPLPVVTAIALGLVYFLVKEVGDMARGGTFLDSYEDTLLIMMGGFYGWPGQPMAVLLTGLGIMVLAHWKARHAG